MGGEAPVAALSSHADGDQPVARFGAPNHDHGHDGKILPHPGGRILQNQISGRSRSQEVMRPKLRVTEPMIAVGRGCAGHFGASPMIAIAKVIIDRTEEAMRVAPASSFLTLRAASKIMPKKPTGIAMRKTLCEPFG